MHGSGGVDKVVRCGPHEKTWKQLTTGHLLFYRAAPVEERLIDGLSRAISHVPLYSGRLCIDGDVAEIVLNDAGVPVVTAVDNMTLATAIALVNSDDCTLIDPIDSAAALVGEAPLLTVRLTYLADGAMALGITFHHVVGDFSTAAAFLRTWSAFVDGVEPPPVDFATDRDVLLDAALPSADGRRSSLLIADLELIARAAAEAPPVCVDHIYFSPAEVRAMKEDYGRHILGVSTGDIVYAHLYGTLHQVSGGSVPERATWMANVRRLLGIGHAVVGNFIEQVAVECDPVGNPASFAAQINAANNDHQQILLDMRADRDFLALVDTPAGVMVLPDAWGKAKRAFFISNMTRFGVYDISFHGQRPVLFLNVIRPPLAWFGHLIEGPEDGGYLFSITIPTDISARLRGSEKAVLHRFRGSDDPLPGVLADSVRPL